MIVVTTAIAMAMLNEIIKHGKTIGKYKAYIKFLMFVD